MTDNNVCTYTSVKDLFLRGMKIKYLLVVVLCLSAAEIRAAEYVFQYNSRCRDAYHQYLSLRLEEGNSTIRREMMSNPYNLMATYISDYEDCLLLLFNGSEKDYKQRKGHFEERLDLIENGDEDDPWYRLCKAGLYLHWSLVYIRFGENFKAATNFRKSYLLIKENRDLFPDFSLNNVFLGMEEAVAGTIPDDYKWLASIFGMKGNVRKGIGKVAAFVKNTKPGDPLREEALIYYCYLKFYLLSQQEEVWNFVNTNQFQQEHNYLSTFILANLGINYRKGETALKALREVESEPVFSQFPIFGYELASALLLKLDPDAVNYFNHFLKSYSGRFFIKDTWQQMAISYYIHGDVSRAGYCRGQIARQGTTNTDADKQAKRFGEGNIWPAVAILQARLLIDGGYYTLALAKLQGCDINNLSSPVDKLEYYFRMGRVYDELKNEGKAIQFYQTTINMGRNRKEHFAARSALQMGWIYERSGRIQEAISRFRECLSMKGHDFQANIDQQAKAGLSRLTQK